MATMNRGLKEGCQCHRRLDHWTGEGFGGFERGRVGASSTVFTVYDRYCGGTGGKYGRAISCTVVGLVLSLFLLFPGGVSGDPTSSTDDGKMADRRATYIQSRHLYSGIRSSSPETFSPTSDSTGRGWYYYFYSSPSYHLFCSAPSVLGDGACDRDYNYEVCGFDGGDCCEETCVDAENKCGIDGYDCWDPDQERETQEPQYSSTLYADDDHSGSSEGCNVIWINDGECDHRNNWEKCNYDGGDCCRESCVDSKHTCGDYFLCRDPDIATPAPTATFFNRTCLSESIGDSVCDPENNYELCLYDGGDCCAPSCEGDNCGRVGYNCTDPETPDYGPDCNMEYVGDGECDPVTNIQECHYDGGDCCEETCVDSNYVCSPYNCTDPNAFYRSAATTCTNAYIYYFAWPSYVVTLMFMWDF